MKLAVLCVWQLQTEVRRSAEKYQAACVACDKCKQTLMNIDQRNSTAASVTAEELESLNAATDEVSMSTVLSVVYYTLLPVCHSRHPASFFRTPD